MFFSKETNGFYSNVIHGGEIPCDSIKISEEEYKTLLDGVYCGGVIEINKDGRPFISHLHDHKSGM